MDVDKIIEQMTLEDKIALCSGESFWETKKFEKYGIPALFMCDGPHGLRKQERGNGTDMLGVNESSPATCFPAEVTTAGTWDQGLMEEIGKAIGEEALDQGVGLVLGPGANVKRNPLCGRNFEYFSEDPFLTGKMAAGFIRGIEKEGVGTSLKHFAANSQEKSRFNSDSIMDERTLRELYLTGFEIAVKEGKPSTVMCAYPKLNGVHCSDNRKLLDQILRKEWGFDGMVITDWGAMNDRIEGFRAGCDLNMPGGSEYMEKEAVRAVKNGQLSETYVNDSVRHILKFIFREQQLRKNRKNCDYGNHHEIARKAAEEGAVLLKNEEGLLPLNNNQKITVIGRFAEHMRYQGAGSSHINPIKLVHPLECLTDAGYAEGYDEDGTTDQTKLQKAVQMAKEADAVVLFAGLPAKYESEGFDREQMYLPEGQLLLIEKVAEVNKNVVVVLFSGCVVECGWADSVKAVLYMGLPGQAGGEAIANLLYGKVSPSGKLAETWWNTYEDVPSSQIYGKTKDALYEEGIYAGYRYCEKAGVHPRFPFGYGLSYTTFSYSELRVREDAAEVVVRNTGRCAGSEVVQLYVEAPQNGIHRPVRELKGFQKIRFQPGESKRVLFSLEPRSFAVWQDGWKIQEGMYRIWIGGQWEELSVKGELLEIPSWQKGSFYEHCHGKPVQKEWEAMIGRTYVPQVLKKGQFTMDNTVEEMKDSSVVMKIMYKAVEKTVAKGFAGKIDYENPQFRMLMSSSAGSPLRSMQISGGMKGSLMAGLLEMANGHYLRGIRKMVKGE